MPRRRPSHGPRIKAQRELFERFVETSGQSLGMADLEGRIFYANAALCRMLGEERSEHVYQKDIFAYYDPKTAESLRQEVLPLVTREGQWVGELLLISRQGYVTPTIENIYLLRDDSGKPLCIANVITDISQNKRMEQEICAYRDHLEDLVSERTADLEMSNALLHKEIAERKQVEKILKISEERFRRLTENAKDMIFRMSLPDGHYEYVSPAAIEISGYEPADFYRNPLLIQKVIHPDWSDYLVREFENIMKGALSPAYEFKIMHRSGQERWVHQRNVMVKDEEGRPLAIEGIVTDITARKQAEESLRESEVRIREMIDNAPFGAHSYKLEEDGRLIFLGANPTADHILNIDHATLNGMPIEKAFPLLPAEIPEKYRDVARTGQRWVKEITHYEDQIISGAFEVFAFQTGPNRMTAFFHDITERKRGEEERRRLTAILENTSDLVAIARPDGHLIYINEAGRRMLGYDRGEDASRYTLNEAHPAWARRIVLEEGLPGARMHGVWQGETAVLNRDGRETPVSQVILANRKANGYVDFFSTIIRDMSERKQAEAALRASEEKYRLLTEGMKDVVWTLDPQTMRYLYVSPSVTALRGFTPEEIMAAPAEEAFVPSVRENLKEFIQQHAADILAGKEKPGQFYTNVLEQTCIDGSTVWTEVISRFYRNKETGAIEIRGVARDITERKHLEEQLLQAQKMESIGRLAGGVAHDFNNLLTAILGNTELALLGKDVGPKASARLQVVQQAAVSAAELTKQLLAFSRKQIIEPQVIDLNELIWNMGKMLARVIGEDIALRSTSQPGLSLIKVDPGQIQQIIMNLAVNARDAMSEGGVLTIETANAVLDEAFCLRHGYGKPGAHVMLAVSDTGMGMSAEVKEHLFEPFFTTKALGKGTGLGLATVYGAVKQNNGYIDVYSEPGQGTCFKILFPAAPHDTEEEPAAPDERLPGGSETVLLVEDDPGVLEFARSVLEMLGYRVLAAASGEEAQALAKDYGGIIELLMTDVKLPGMNGRQLADMLSHDRPAIKILFNSGYTYDAIVHHGVLEQDLHFIGKPFSAQALAHKLRQVLEED